MNIKKLIIYTFIATTILSAIYITPAFFYDVEKLKKSNPIPTSFMIYRQKQWASNGEQKQIKHFWVPLNQISRNMRVAVIVSEDSKFWKHDGFDFDAIQNAFEENFKSWSFKYGASTISQQVVKNVYLSPTKNPLRKIKEAILTYRMEQVVSKKRILELYLNTAEFGDGIFGIGYAAKYYFHKPASTLTVTEAAKLAAILPNPIKYRPNDRHKFVIRRTNIIAERILKVATYTPRNKK